MIAKLVGTIDSILDDSIVLDVCGVGYVVYTPSKLRDSFIVGDKCTLRIIHIFKQDSQYLCGFQDEKEMHIFKELMDVPGIGLRSAMSVLSTLSVRDFAMAVINQDANVLCGVSGIGKKTAGRILLELKDKMLSKIKDIYSDTENQNINDAILGLISLGYQKNNALKVVKDTANRLGPSASVNELIVNCLKDIR
jgi:Holliday junction DNA helicase RuvA